MSTMAVDLVSLTFILLLATVAPIIARIIPGNIVPEVVLLLLGGALLGPYGADLITTSDSIDMLSQLGLAFLFLLAGYDIDPQILKGHVGRSGLATWIVTFGIALALAFGVPRFAAGHLNSVAVAIAMCTTALGTLIPILTERSLVGTPVGTTILAYGTWGELMPILAMALLLSTRAKWQTILILGMFLGICLVLAIVPKRARKAGSAIFGFLEEKSGGSSQTLVRVTSLLLVLLVTATVAFDLDAVLGAFAAGFILRYIIPEGNEALEYKLNAIGYGFFIPIFFVVSGATIDLRAVASNPGLLIWFIVLLLLVRAVPVFVGESVDPATKTISLHHRITVALYCTTALPLIVAVTTVSVSSGQMEQSTASVLVASGAVTVFLMPLLGSLTYKVADVHPVAALGKIVRNPGNSIQILKEHRDFSRLLSHENHLERRAVQTAPGAESEAEFGPQVFETDSANNAKWREWNKALQQASTGGPAHAGVASDAAQATAAMPDAIAAAVTTAGTETPGTAALSASASPAVSAESASVDAAQDASTGTAQQKDEPISITVTENQSTGPDGVIRHPSLRRGTIDLTNNAHLKPSHHMTIDHHRVELAKRVIAERNKRLKELGLDPDKISRNPSSDQFLAPPDFH